MVWAMTSGPRSVKIGENERGGWTSERPRRPEWMKVRAPSADGRYFDVKKLIHGATKGLVESLGDDFSSFLTPQEATNVNSTMQGNILSSVACISASDCWVVGYSRSSSVRQNVWSTTSVELTWAARTVRLADSLTPAAACSWRATRAAGAASGRPDPAPDRLQWPTPAARFGASIEVFETAGLTVLAPA